jgi:hypothetical protein
VIKIYRHRIEFLVLLIFSYGFLLVENYVAFNSRCSVFCAVRDSVQVPWPLRLVLGRYAVSSSSLGRKRLENSGKYRMERIHTHPVPQVCSSASPSVLAFLRGDRLPSGLFPSVTGSLALQGISPLWHTRQQGVYSGNCYFKWLSGAFVYLHYFGCSLHSRHKLHGCIVTQHAQKPIVFRRGWGLQECQPLASRCCPVFGSCRDRACGTKKERTMDNPRSNLVPHQSNRYH